MSSSPLVAPGFIQDAFRTTPSLNGDFIDRPFTRSRFGAYEFNQIVSFAYSRVGTEYVAPNLETIVLTDMDPYIFGLARNNGSPSGDINLLLAMLVALKYGDCWPALRRLYIAQSDPSTLGAPNAAIGLRRRLGDIGYLFQRSSVDLEIFVGPLPEEVQKDFAVR